MDTQLVMDEKTLKRIPHIFILFLILICGLPVIAFNLFGFNFSTLSERMGLESILGNYLVEAQIRGYFRQMILQWSAFALAAITVLLAFTQYRLTNDKISLIIGLSVLFSGSVEALHTIILDGITPQFIDKANLDAVIWIFSNTASGLIIVIGLILLLKWGESKPFSLTTFCLISALLVTVAFTLIYYTALIVKLPRMWYPDNTLSRPYDIIYLLVYGSIATILYPITYKKYPNILTNCIFYMAITEIVIALYLMLLSNVPYDNAFNSAYFLKIVVYFIPFACLINNYVFSYNNVLQAQLNLQISKDQLKYLAGHDSLTDLFNRREFENQINQRIVMGGRDKDQFALLLIDVDNFKAINDSLGHLYGDEYIKRFSEQFLKLIRKEDILSRIGGDEFTLITNTIKSPKEAAFIAKRLLEGLNIAIPVKQDTISKTCSIGIAIYPDDGKTSQELLRKADIAMYTAKSSGKNNYKFYSET